MITALKVVARDGSWWAVTWSRDKSATTGSIIHHVNLVMASAAAQGIDVNDARFEWVEEA